MITVILMVIVIMAIIPLIVIVSYKVTGVSKSNFDDVNN